MTASCFATISTPDTQEDNSLRPGPFGPGLPQSIYRDIRQKTRHYAANNTLLQDGDEFSCVLIVLQGWLSTSKSLENGEIQLIDFIMPGDVLNPTAADGLTSCLNVEAITDVAVSILPTSTWHDILHRSPELQQAMENIEAAERTRMSERLLRIGKGSAQNRVAYTLLELCIRLGALGLSTSRGFHVPLTQKHLGDFTGLSSVHVCRTMRRFVRNGIIETDDHMDIRIKDLTGLSEIAGITPERLAAEITASGVHAA